MRQKSDRTLGVVEEKNAARYSKQLFKKGFINVLRRIYRSYRPF
jgi:hypothetical protein